MLTAIVDRTARNASKGRASTDYRYQIGPPPALKQEVLVAGDKVWNPTLLLLHGNPQSLGSLEDRLGVPVRLVYTIRNPFDVIATMQRRSGLSVRNRVRWYFMHCEAAEALRERLPRSNFLETHHSHLLADPEAELHRIGDFLGLPHDPAHVEAVKAMLFDQPRCTAESLAWDPADVADILGRMAKFQRLARYARETAVNPSSPPTSSE